MIWIALAIYYILGVIVIQKASPRLTREMQRASITSLGIGYILILQVWILPFISGNLVRAYNILRKGK